MPDGRPLLGEPPRYRPAASPSRTLRYRSPRHLARINEPDIDLLIWRRTLPATLGEWLDALPAHRLPQGRVLAAAGSLGEPIAALHRGRRRVSGWARGTQRRKCCW
ncbi:MAG TPA: DUF1826 domain-containing protein [Bradyrhizobium sp.]|nr:DUF1826 domain-containing protein [Bradyrhizobium sp.]